MPSRIRWFDVLLLSGAAVFGSAVVAAATLSPKDGEDGVAVIFAPWTSASDAFERASGSGARFVRFGAFDFIAVVEPERRDYARQVTSQGAWLLASPAVLAACLRPFASRRS